MENIEINTINFSKKVKLARTSLDMTQESLAERIGVSTNHISKIERGLANPSLSTLNRLAGGMGLKLKIEFVDQGIV